MELQSIYFDIDLTANLEVKDWLDVRTLSYERIVGELFAGSVVLVDRQGNCLMLNGVSVMRVIGCLDGYLQAINGPRPAGAAPVGCGELSFHLFRQGNTLVLMDTLDGGDCRLEFEAASFEALWHQKKRNAGTLFWLLYPELEQHGDAALLRQFFGEAV